MNEEHRVLVSLLFPWALNSHCLLEVGFTVELSETWARGPRRRRSRHLKPKTRVWLTLVLSLLNTP